MLVQTIVAVRSCGRDSLFRATFHSREQQATLFMSSGARKEQMFTLQSDGRDLNETVDNGGTATRSLSSIRWRFELAVSQLEAITSSELLFVAISICRRDSIRIQPYPIIQCSTTIMGRTLGYLLYTSLVAATQNKPPAIDAFRGECTYVRTCLLPPRNREPTDLIIDSLHQSRSYEFH